MIFGGVVVGEVVAVKRRARHQFSYIQIAASNQYLHSMKCAINQIAHFKISDDKFIGYDFFSLVDSFLLSGNRTINQVNGTLIKKSDDIIGDDFALFSYGFERVN